MKFFRNECFQTRFAGLDEAVREVHFSCMIPLRDIPNLFKEIKVEHLNKSYFDKLYQKRPVFLPGQPFADFHLEEGEVIVKREGNYFVEETKTIFDSITYVKNPRTGIAFHKPLPIGTRLYLTMDDVMTWIFYQWLNDFLVIQEERCYYEDDFRFPSLDAFLLNPFGASNIQGMSESQVTVNQLFVPNRKAIAPFRKWLRLEGNEDRLVTSYLGQENLTINLGIDARILAYYASKEDRKPLWLSSLF